MSTVSGLQRIIRCFLEQKIDTEDLKRIMEAPPLAVTSLMLPDIQKIFGLTQAMDDEFESVEPIPVPQDLSISAR